MQVEYKNDVLVKNVRANAAAAPVADMDARRPRTSTKKVPGNSSSSPWRKPATATEVRRPKTFVNPE